MPASCRAADLFLLTSVSEGIPLTVIEAMAAGLPVVATRVGGVGEIVDDGRTGLLAPAGDDEALAVHLLRLAECPGVARGDGPARPRTGCERSSPRARCIAQLPPPLPGNAS